MPRFRKTTWAMLIWSVLCAIVTIAWIGSDVSGPSELKRDEAVQVDDEFAVTLLSTSPVTVRIENLIQRLLLRLLRHHHDRLPRSRA